MEHSLRSVMDWGLRPNYGVGPRRLRSRASWRTPTPATVRALRGFVVWLVCVLFLHTLASTLHHGVATGRSSAMCMRR